MNICVIGPKHSKASLAIKLAAEARGHSCRRFYMNDFYFEVHNGKLTAGHRKESVEAFDVFIFRSLNSEYYEAMQLASCLKDLGKKIIDIKLADSPMLMSVYSSLEKANVAQVNRTRTMGLKSARDILMDFNHPVIVKPLDQSSSKFTYSDDWTDSYDIVRTEKSKKFEFQELPKVEYYYSILLIGDEVIAGMKKTPKEGENKLNYSKKFSYESLEVSESLKSFAKSAHKAVGYDIASIEVVEIEGEYKVLEVLRAPKILKFQKVTGINVPDKVVEFIER